MYVPPDTTAKRASAGLCAPPPPPPPIYPAALERKGSRGRIGGGDSLISSGGVAEQVGPHNWWALPAVRATESLGRWQIMVREGWRRDDRGGCPRNEIAGEVAGS